MELLMIVLLWPLLIFAVGVVGVAYFAFNLPWIIIIAFVAAVVLSKRFVSQAPALTYIGERSMADQLEIIRGMALVFSISLLWPVFSRYLVESLSGSLAAIITVLVVGFGLVTWGMFIRENKSIMYSNIFGGALTIAYAYQQLWDLGQGPRVVAAAFGLIVAVGVSVFKFRDKLK